MEQKLTTVQYLGQLSFEAYTREKKLRDACNTRQEALHIDQKSYEQGKAIAYMDAQRIVENELKRLRNLWQNNTLTYDAFNAGY